MNALLCLPSLTSEQRQFVRRKQIADTRTPDEWLQFFQSIDRFETDLEPGTALTVFLWVCGAGALLLAIGAFTGRNPIVGVLLLALAFLPLSHAVSRQFFALRGRRLRRVLSPLLAILREDLEPGDRVALRVDLRGAKLQEKQAGERRLPNYGNYTSIVQTTYVDEWLTGDGTLADGTRLLWSVTDAVRVVRRTKRNPRGKTSWKTKFRVVTKLRLQIGWRTDSYTVKAGTLAPEETTSDGRRVWLKLRRNFGRAPQPDFNAVQFAQTVMNAYNRTTPVGGTK